MPLRWRKLPFVVPILTFSWRSHKMNLPLTSLLENYYPASSPSASLAAEYISATYRLPNLSAILTDAIAHSSSTTAVKKSDHGVFHCFRVMNGGLRFNICEVETSYHLATMISIWSHASRNLFPIIFPIRACLEPKTHPNSALSHPELIQEVQDLFVHPIFVLAGSPESY